MQGGTSIEELKSLPLDELYRQIAMVNKAADQEKMLNDSKR